MFGWMQPSAALTFNDDFAGTSLSMRNAVPSGTNMLRNSAAYAWGGASGATLPENWSITAVSGVTSSVVGQGLVTLASQSMTYTDLRISGTASGAVTIYLPFEVDAVLRASAGQNLTASMWLAITAGSKTNVTNVSVHAQTWTDAGGFVSDGTTSVVSALNATATRYSATLTSAGTGSNYAKCFLQFDLAAGAVNATFRIVSPQLEVGTSATTFVSTSANTGTWNTRDWTLDTIDANEVGYYVNIARDGTRLSGGNNPYSVASSILTLTAQVAPGGTCNGQPYSTGGITTEGGFSQTYGYFEARVKMVSGSGMWGGFWMLPQPSTGAATELDMVEVLGVATTTAHCTLHSADYGAGANNQDTHAVATGVDLTLAYHLYGCEWRSDKIIWYLDRKPITSDTTTSDMHAPTHLKCTFQLGSSTSWASAVDSSKIPATMLVDYIQAWDRLPF